MGSTRIRASGEGLEGKEEEAESSEDSACCTPIGDTTPRDKIIQTEQDMDDWEYV